MDKGLTLGRRRMKSRKHTNDLLLLSIFSIVVFLITFKLLGADQPKQKTCITSFHSIHHILPISIFSIVVFLITFKL